MKKEKFDSCLSVTTTWTDSKSQTITNKMVIKGKTITFRNTFRVETKEVFDSLLELRKGEYETFKKSEQRILNNALLKIGREQCKNRLTEYDFSTHRKKGSKKILVIRN